MPEGAYSAGTIFLQVVPVFGDTMNRISREAKKANRALGDEMEKGGKDAGERASRAIGDELEKGGRDAGKRSGDAFEQAFKNAVTRAMSKLGDSSDPAVRRIKDSLKNLDARVGVDLDDTEAIAKLAAIRKDIARLNRETVSPRVEMNTGKAHADLAKFHAYVNRVDGDKINIKADVDTGASMGKLAMLGGLIDRLKNKNQGLATDGIATANAFRAFSFVVAGLAAILPAVIPLLGALGGGLIALGPILAGLTGGVGTLILGFSGIGNAVQALMKQDAAAAKDADATSKKMQGAYRQVADAHRALARAEQEASWQRADAARAVAEAERQSSRAIAQALEQQQQAQESLANAQRDATQAQKDLTQAKQQARQDEQNLADQQAQNSLDRRQALIDVFNSTVAYNSTMQDGASTNLDKEQASIALGQAKLRLKELREQQRELAKEKRKSDKEGVSGTDAVVQAHNALLDALQREKDAEQALGDASKAVDQARADGARSVADALRQQHRVQITSAQSIQDAHRNLTRAQQDYQRSLTETGVIGSSSMQAVEQAMKNLSPAGREFARYLFSLRKQFYALRTIAQQGILPGVEAGMKNVIGKDGGLIRTFVKRMSGTIGDLFRMLGKMLTNPLWKAFFKMLDRLGPRFMRQFGKGIMDWMSVFARLLTIAAPWAKKFSDALLGVSDAVLQWMKSKKATKLIQDFMDYAAEQGPKVLKLILALAGAFINLMVALAPYGGAVMAALTGILNFIAGMDPTVLGLIAGGIVAITLAFQAMQGVLALASAMTTMWLALMSGGVLPWVLGFVGIGVLVVAALVLMYVKFKWFRNMVNAIFHALGVAAKWLWNKALMPAFRGIGKAAQWLWDKVLHPVFKAIGAIFKWLWKYVVHPYFKLIGWYWSTIFKAMKWAWENILFPIIDFFGHLIAKVLWATFIRPTLNLIKAAWKGLAEAWQWSYEHVIHPAIEKFKEAMDWLHDKIAPIVGKIQDLWDGLVNKLGTPIRAVIQFTNKYLIGGFNKLAHFVGSKPMGKIPVPSFAQMHHSGGNAGRSYSNGGAGGHLLPAAAKGAIMPGYTPGRDVMYAHVSGGEAIMRPEWTRAVGADTINEWNRVARVHGAEGLRKMFAGAFARGGVVWPTTGRMISTYPGHDGVDINAPGNDIGNPIFAFRSGRIVYTGWNHGYGDAIFERIPGGPTVVYGHGSQVLVHAGQNVQAGQLIGRVGYTGNVKPAGPAGAHLHFGVPGGTFNEAMALLGGAKLSDSSLLGKLWGGVKGAASSVAGWVKAALAAPVHWLEDRVSGALSSITDNPLGKMLGKGVMSLAHDAGSFIKHLLGMGDESNYGTSVSHWAPTVQRALSMLGQPKSLTSAVLHRIAQESGGNPMAVNNWDINAQNGVPSTGLMQVIAPTFAQWAGPFRNVGPFKNGVSTNPLANIYAGLNYALHKYGNIEGPMLQPGGYSEGGIVPDGGGVADNGTMMYDNGGYLPPGLTTVLNMTGKPEPVFTSEQWGRMADGTGSGIHYEPHFEGSDLTAQDVANDLDFAFRRLSKRGKYAGTGR